MARYGNQRVKHTPFSLKINMILQDERDFKGLSNKALSVLSGMSEASLTRIFKNGRVLDVAELETLCKVLNLSPSEVIRQAESVTS